MRKLFLPLIVFLLVPLSAVLAEANKEILIAGKLFSDSFVKSFFYSFPLVFKIFLPSIVFFFLLKIGLFYLEKRLKKRNLGKK